MKLGGGSLFKALKDLFIIFGLGFLLSVGDAELLGEGRAEFISFLVKAADCRSVEGLQAVVNFITWLMLTLKYLSFFLILASLLLSMGLQGLFTSFEVRMLSRTFSVFNSSDFLKAK